MSLRSALSVPMIPFDFPAMIDLRYVKKLIEMLDGSTVDSIEISSDKGMKLRISKSSQQRVATMTVAPQMAAPVAMAPVLPAAGSERPAGEGAAAPKAEAPKVALLEIKSPMVGTYYSAPEPGAKPYINVGDRISKGQIVCIIEAMKMFNPIEADVSGTVTAVLVQPGQAIEFDEAMFIIS
jgi:acetyl-CoA carboxylase biotin carboxyl carrier protein